MASSPSTNCLAGPTPWPMVHDHDATWGKVRIQRSEFPPDLRLVVRDVVDHHPHVVQFTSEDRNDVRHVAETQVPPSPKLCRNRPARRATRREAPRRLRDATR